MIFGQRERSVSPIVIPEELDQSGVSDVVASPSLPPAASPANNANSTAEPVASPANNANSTAEKVSRFRKVIGTIAHIFKHHKAELAIGAVIGGGVATLCVLAWPAIPLLGKIGLIFFGAMAQLAPPVISHSLCDLEIPPELLK
ncbi:MAG: hypothetical protein COT84_00500 [Chlamydiae bacterium CG10_big_fil_rev_8_21_14_0_10_35_9]|nr:MAG: hypothetical protein COT84_00500 [Chlamydiae bacterium CG10_big_fil_rev_8_21_14_0_10_35_9]